jgi:hypothetical protein
MTQYICLHCNFGATDRTQFPNSEHVCKNCMRDRPIAWKAALYILARSNDSFPTELKTKPAKRAKALHHLQNLSNPPTKELMERICFDTIVFKEWTKKKVELQTFKGGQCAYSDACLEYMTDWFNARRSSGNINIHESDIEKCSWTESHTIPSPTMLSPWSSPSPVSAVSAIGDNSVVPEYVISEWELKMRKAQRKNKILRKSYDELEQRSYKTDQRNNELEIANQTMRALIAHLTNQLINVQLTSPTIPFSSILKT